MWLVNQFNNMITALIQGIINDILKLIVDILGAFLVNPINMNSLPGYSMLQTAIEGLCTVALGCLVVKELMLNQYESIGDMDAPPLVIVKNAFVSMFLIWLSPLLIQEVILRIVVNLSVIVSKTVGANVDVKLDSLLALQAGATGAIAGQAATEQGATTVASAWLESFAPDLGFWAAVVIIVIMIIGFAIIGIQSGMRWAELYFLALVGPMLALGRVSFSNSWGLWLRETIATAFSQLVQYFATLLAILMMVHPGQIDTANGSPVSGIVKLLMILGLIVFAIVGPQKLRGIISGGSPTGMRAVTSIAKSAAGGLPIGG